VARLYEELDRAITPLGELLLVRRKAPGAPDGVAFEVKLAGALLMSSLVTESERALARLALGGPGPARPHVLVGGLGLGYTAAEALDQPGVESVEVVDLLPQVVDWHRRGLVPLAARLTADPRCRLVVDDVFARLAAPPTRPYDAILLDVDHSPDALLRPEHGSFYRRAGLAAASQHLAPGGVLAVWSALAPERAFERRLGTAFRRVQCESVAFWNANNDAHEVNAVYLAWR
jgi:spermidine synthase